MVYLIIFILGLALAGVGKQKMYAKIFAAMLILIAVFRYGFGADYFSYGALYSWETSNVFKVSSTTGGQEIGFRLLMAVFKQLNLSYQIFIAFFAIFNICFVYKLAVKYTVNPTFTMVIYYTCYYFVWTFSSLRQGLAIVIGLYYLLEAINDKRHTIKFLIITVLLSLLHTSAFVFIVFYSISRLKLNKIHLLVLLVISFAFSLLPLGLIVNKLSANIYIFERISYYVGASLVISDFLNFKTIARIVFLVFGFVIYDVYCQENSFNKKLMNIYIFSFAIYFIFKFSELTAARLAIYGKVLDIIILSNIMYILKKKENEMIYILSLLVLIALYFFKELNTMVEQSPFISTYNYIVPYVNIFNEKYFVFNNIWDTSVY